MAAVAALEDQYAALALGRSTSGSQDATIGDRLQALPPDALRHVLRCVGRPVRLVCRHWRATYGPLTGLYLDHPSTETHLLALFPPPCPAPQPRALYLAARTPQQEPFNMFATKAYQDATLASLPATFPALRALHLDPEVALSPQQVSQCLPPALTALTVCLDPSAAAYLPAATPSLRSLSIVCTPASLPSLLPALTSLSATLRHLHLACWVGPSQAVATPQALPVLAALCHLTHLHLECSMSDWDPPSLALLATAWPCLASLHLEPAPPTPDDVDGPGPPCPCLPDFAAALARRTALTSLSLCALSLSLPYPHLPYLHLTTLARLRHLSLTAFFPPPAADALAPLLPALTALTRLSLDCWPQPGAPGSSSAPSLDALAPLAPTLRHLHFSCFEIPFLGLLPLTHLTSLHALHLDASRFYGLSYRTAPTLPADQHAAQCIGAALSHLTSLVLNSSGHGWPADALLAAVASHGRLRHFSTNVCMTHLLACLAPARKTLGRLEAVVVDTSGHMDACLSGLAGLEELRYVSCASTSGLRVCNTLGQGHPPPQGPQPQPQQGAREARVLPPKLSVLHAPRLGGYGSAGMVRAVLREAGQQGCLLVEAGSWSGDTGMVCSLRLPQYDDCNGYLEGAAPGFRRWGDDACGVPAEQR